MRGYIDDFYVFGDTWVEFKENFHKLMQRCREHQIYLARKKLRVHPDSFEVLGKIISRDGVSIDPKRVVTIDNIPAPSNKQALLRVLGLFNYNGQHIKDLSTLMAPLSELTGDVPYRWSGTCQAAFDKLKERIKDARTLATIREDELAPQGTKPIHRDTPPRKKTIVDNPTKGQYLFLITDASQLGVGGMLAVGTNWWNARPVGYFSKKFDTAQNNYPTHEQELLAVIEGLKAFSSKLLHREFTVITDNMALKYFMSAKQMSGRQARWLEALAAYRFDIQHIKGTSNVVADALSRQYEDDEASGHHHRDASEFATADKEIEERFEGADQPSISNLNIHKGRARRAKRSTVKDKAAESRPTAKAARLQRKLARAQQARKDSEWAASQLTEEYADDAFLPGFVTAIGYALLDDRQAKEVVKNPSHFVDTWKVRKLGQISLLYTRGSTSESWRLYVPFGLFKDRKLSEIILEHVHAVAGHASFKRTLKAARDNFYWKEMSTDIEAYCRTCPSCQASKPSTLKPSGLLHPLDIPTQPWEVIGIDFVGVLPPSKQGNNVYNFIMVCIDHLSGEVELVPCRDQVSAEDAAQLYFQHVYKLHGLPEKIVSDRDVRWRSAFWKTIHEILGTTLAMSTSYHPQTNGKTERMNRTMHGIMRQVINEEQTDWVARLPIVQFAINSSPSEPTGLSPFEITRGYTPRTLPKMLGKQKAAEISDVQEFANKAMTAVAQAQDALIATKLTQTTQANKHRRANIDKYGEHSFRVGDQAWLATADLALSEFRTRKWTPPFMGPYKILAVDQLRDILALDLPEQLTQRGINPIVHTSKVKKFLPTDEKRFPNRISATVPTFPIDSEEMAVSKILKHQVVQSGDMKRVELLVQFEDGTAVWKDLAAPDISTELEAVQRYLKWRGVDQLDDLNEQNVPVSPLRVKLKVRGPKLTNVMTARSSKFETDARARQGKSPGRYAIHTSSKDEHRRALPAQATKITSYASSHTKDSRYPWRRPVNIDDIGSRGRAAGRGCASSSSSTGYTHRSNAGPGQTSSRLGLGIELINDEQLRGNGRRPRPRSVKGISRYAVSVLQDRRSAAQRRADRGNGSF